MILMMLGGCLRVKTQNHPFAGLGLEAHAFLVMGFDSSSTGRNSNSWSFAWENCIPTVDGRTRQETRKTGSIV